MTETMDKSRSKVRGVGATPVSPTYARKPWLGLYRDGAPATIVAQHADLLSIFKAAVERAASSVAVQYFDGVLTYQQLDTMSDHLAMWLAEKGVAKGDRVAVILQNVPHFVIAQVASWKIGAVPMPINPMNRHRELTMLFTDGGPKAVICHQENHDVVALALGAAGLPKTVQILPVDAREFQTRNDRRVLPSGDRAPSGDGSNFEEVIRSSEKKSFVGGESVSQDIAFLVYTSGTTGVPKGAMITHGNASFNSQVYRDWMGLEEGGGILGIAPLFHVTGLIGHIAAAFLCAAPLVLSYRFDPEVMLESIVEHRPQFIIGAITAFVAMMNAPSCGRHSFESIRRIYSGGAPIPPAVVDQFEEKCGHYIHNGYGLTETTSPSHCVPFGRRAPVDPTSGALSVGVPVFNTDVLIMDEAGKAAPIGELGEIVTKGPQVVPGYWNKPEETAESIPDGWLRTGDIGFMDADGWFYLVDRKKDMINASGYKVWPREVEDVLYTHPAVREAAVIGVPDEYRGETVKAVVSLKAGQEVAPQDLIAFCKERMASYKYPRAIDVISDLPKTVTGKILRRELRDKERQPARPMPLKPSAFSP
jgi:long-chain acyl-CoA synthetase